MNRHPPHLSGATPVTVRRGAFWIPGDPVATAFGTVQRGPMYVEWEAPPAVTRPHPLILVHGGGGQSTDWRTTADGRPGWIDAFVAAGFAVYVVDRPGHGRSPHHPAVLGAPGVPGGIESTIGIFANPDLAPAHTQWPWDRDPGGAEIAQLAASAGFLPEDLAAANDLDGTRLAQLLDVTGPAVLVTHSVGASGGWLAANRRPGAVHAVVAIEPIGPPFLSMPGLGALTWGLTAAPLETRPSITEPAELTARAGELRFPGLDGVPVAVVTAPASPFAAAGPATVDFLRGGGVRAELLRLEDHGVLGNGHGMMLEANSDAAVQPIVRWIAAQE